MRYEIIQKPDRLENLSLSKDTYPVFVSESFLFVGPSVREEGNCVKCMIENLKDHKSLYHALIMNALQEEKEVTLKAYEKDYLEQLDMDLTQKMLVVSRQNLALERVFNFCHAKKMCKYGSAKESDQTLNLNYEFRLDKREKSGDDIFDQKNREKLINAHAGIGNKLLRDVYSKIIPMYYIKSNAINKEYYAYGRSDTLKKSKMSAMFEMLERYASTVPHTQNAIHSSFQEMIEKGYHTIAPEKLHLNVIDEDTKEMYGFEEFDENKKYHWMKTKNIINGEDAYLPEQVIYYDTQFVRDEKRFIYETSNGTAMGGSYEEAVIYALLELTERDAFLMNWYNKVAPIHLDITGIKDKTLVDIVKYMECIGYDIYVMDITMETKIPAVWVAAIDKKENTVMKCYNAAGAHLNPEKALEAALVEVVTSIGVYEVIINSGEEDERIEKLRNRPDMVKQMEDHVYFYSLEENFKYIEDYYKNPTTVSFTERFKDWYEEDLHIYTMQNFIDKFKKYYDELYVGVMDNLVNEELGLWCVKVIAPKMLTMTFGVRNQRINLERIQKGAVLAGIRSEEIPEEEINMLPHPFP